MDKWSEKSEHYQKVVDEIGAGDETVSHAVLLTAHPEEKSETRHKLLISGFKVGKDKLINLLKQALRILEAEDKKDDTYKH